MQYVLSFISALLFFVSLLSATPLQAERADYSKAQGSYYLEVVQQHLTASSTDSALHYARLAYEWYEMESQSVDSQAVAGLQVAIVLNQLGKNEEGLSLILEVISKARLTKNDTLLAASYGRAGIIYNHMFMDKDAQEMFQKSYEQYIKSDTTKAYQQLSNLSLLRARFPSTVRQSLADQRKIFAYQKKQSDTTDLAKTLINLGVIFTELELFDSAVYCLQKVLPMESGITLTTLENANYYLAMTYLALDAPSKAREFAQRSYDLSVRIGTPTKVSYSSQLLSSVYKQLANYERALYYYAYADSLLAKSFHENYSRRISELKVKYEAEQKQHEIDRLKYESDLAEKERTIYLILFAVLVVVFALAVASFRKKYRLQKLEIKSQKIEKAEVQMELECKKNEFASHSLNLIQKDELLKDIKESIEGVRQSRQLNPDTSEQLRLLVNKLDFNLNTEKNWEDFKLHFEQIHGNFSSSLSRRFPHISSNELRLCSLIKIGLSVKEIATLLNISTQGVKTARYRLRKKFGLKKEDKLLSFLHSLEADMLELS